MTVLLAGALLTVLKTAEDAQPTIAICYVYEQGLIPHNVPLEQGLEEIGWKKVSVQDVSIYISPILDRDNELRSLETLAELLGDTRFDPMDITTLTPEAFFQLGIAGRLRTSLSTFRFLEQEGAGVGINLQPYIDLVGPDGQRINQFHLPLSSSIPKPMAGPLPDYWQPAPAPPSGYRDWRRVTAVIGAPDSTSRNNQIRIADRFDWAARGMAAYSAWRRSMDSRYQAVADLLTKRFADRQGLSQFWQEIGMQGRRVTYAELPEDMKRQIRYQLEADGMNAAQVDEMMRTAVLEARLGLYINFSDGKQSGVRIPWNP